MGMGPQVMTMLEEKAFTGLPRPFTVIELGNQELKFGGGKMPSHDWYKLNGASKVESIDLNGRGTINHDLNLPILLPHPFDLVTDFGTSEHIFDFAQCWRTIHGLTKEGGLIAFDKIYSGVVDHCFYNVQPTTWLDMSAANGYRVEHIEETVVGRSKRVMGVFRKMNGDLFKNPNQGRYKEMLR